MTAPRRYGPHRDEDVPKTLTVLEGGVQWPAEIEVPYPAALAEQRRQINTRAWWEGMQD